MLFGDLLKEHRLKQFWKQEKMAKFLDVPLGTYKNWETNKYFPSLKRVEKLCKKIDRLYPTVVAPLPSARVQEIYYKNKMERKKNG